MDRPLHDLIRNLTRARGGQFDGSGDATIPSRFGATVLKREGGLVIVSLTFQPPLPLKRLEVRNLGEGDLYDFFGNPELTFGEPRFDDALLVRGDPLHEVRRLLRREVRDQLLELWASAGALIVTHEEIRAISKTARATEEHLGRVLDQVDDLARSMVRAERGATGPYR